MTRKLRVLVCGTRFGQFYLEAIQKSNLFELSGILAQGSQRSRSCASVYKTDLYTDIEDVPKDIDIACIVVPTSIMGGSGTELAIQFMKKGIHVLLEQPVHYQNLLECYRVAKQYNVKFIVGDLYVNLPYVTKFIGMAQKIMEKEDLVYLNVDMATQVSFPLAHILAKLFGNLQPWGVKDFISDNMPFQMLSIMIKGVPTTIRAQNQVDVVVSDSYMHLMHQITLGFDSGKLTLFDTNGPVVWTPRMQIPDIALIPRELKQQSSYSLTTPVFEGFEPNYNSTYQEILTTTWPSAILKDVERLYNLITKDMNSIEMRKEGQQIIQTAQLWSDITSALGYPNDYRKTEKPFLNIEEIKTQFRKEATMDYRYEQLTVDSVQQAVAKFNEVCLKTILLELQKNNTLNTKGKVYRFDDINSSIKIAENFQFVLKRWLTSLAKHDYLICVHTGYVLNYPVLTSDEVQRDWLGLKSRWSEQLMPEKVMDYFYRHALLLGDLLTGKQSAVQLLFQDGEMDIATALYKETMIAYYLNNEVSNIVKARIALKNEVQLLEIGAGTGATSTVVIDAIINNQLQKNIKRYMFSDVSSYFLNEAKKTFQDINWMDYMKLDIENETDMSLIENDSQNIILAAGVLNNVKNTKEVLLRLKLLLKNDGMVLLTEADGESLQILISQVFMMEPADDKRKGTSSTFLTTSQWLEIFNEVGFKCMSIQPDKGHKLYPLGQRLFVLEKIEGGSCNG
ncbi:Gfo/Idh/MocA family oxidoreductase [Lysinibacillus sp. UGB7]|uniref:Gfo/Idh/MocA family oxidoreductase n=1 Tax=Lysinibacillus sp. UGB7 TaxID=3411039 RepID=UPI003B78094F